MANPEKRSQRIPVMLFLGAGASVPAGIPDTMKFVQEFEKDIRSHKLKHETVRKLLETLEVYVDANPDRQVDIELLLEALERLEKRERDVFNYFIEGGQYVMNGYLDKGPIRDELREFIRSRVVVQKDKIGYLEPLRELEHRYGVPSGMDPLTIFTVNYDNCIEQFCDQFSLRVCDGFLAEWDPKLFKSMDSHINLFKMHGSTNWFRTQNGKYIKIPIVSEKGIVELDTKEKAEVFIVYPGLKSVYYEPYIDMLGILKERLKRTDIVIVVGYSFRDEDIKKIFWDVAAANRQMIIVLIGPSAAKVHNEQLALIEKGIPSALDGRVLVLPFLFEEVLPNLDKKYIRNLCTGTSFERSAERKGILGENRDYIPTIERYTKCGFVEKIIQYFSLTDFTSNWKLKLVSAVVSLAYLSARGIEYVDPKLVNSFRESVKEMLTKNLLVRVGSTGKVEMLFQPSGPDMEAVRVGKIKGVLEEINAEVDLLARMVQEEQRRAVTDIFLPLEGLIKRYGEDYWDASIDLPKYLEILKAQYEEEAKAINEIVGDKGEPLELTEEERRKIFGIIEAIEQSEIDSCFDVWK